MVSESSTVCEPAVTASVKINSVSASTSGAVNVVGDEFSLLREMAGKRGSCDHEYVKGSPSGSFAVHGMLTDTPSLTVWFGPTMTVGLRFCEVISRMGQDHRVRVRVCAV